MATSHGVVKKTPLKEFSRPLSRGIIAVDLREGDHLVNVAITDGQCDVMLFSSDGRAVRFHESKVRAMGRTACGVRGIRLDEGQKLISLIIVGEGDILTVTENGYGKRTAADQFLAKGRGCRGVISIKTSERNGAQVGALQVRDNDEIMLITDGGTLVRTAVASLSVIGRAAQGVTLIRLSGNQKLVGVERIESLTTDQPEVEGEAEGEAGIDGEAGSQTVAQDSDSAL
jgi:DNA gyrase subunit A